MENSEPSKSGPGYLRVVGQSVKGGALSVADDAMDLAYGPQDTRALVTLAITAAAAIVFPLPFFIAGILSVANGATNGSTRKYGPERPGTDPAFTA